MKMAYRNIFKKLNPTKSYTLLLTSNLILTTILNDKIGKGLQMLKLRQQRHTYNSG